MAARAAVHRSPLPDPRPNAANQNHHANSGVPNPVQPDPGLQRTSQDPGPAAHPQHPVFTRPVFYVHAVNPPPFLHYQMPMPFSYNQFAGFPGMGYSMVMPPYPPPSYMEAPAYLLPHPHLQPMDYRRLVHPQVHPQVPPQVHVTGAAHQSLNPALGVRLPHTVPIRETVNSEVQTEPSQRGVVGYGDGCPLASSDSGQGTTSDSPASSSSSSEKRGSAMVENYTITCSHTKGSEVDSTCTSTTDKHVFNVLLPAGTNAVQSAKTRKDGVGQELPFIPPRSSVWSASSPDCLVPVRSSSQREDEDEGVTERRSSVPDILSWGGNAPQMMKLADNEVLLHKDHQQQTEVEHQRSVQQSPAESSNGSVLADDDADDDDGAGDDDGADDDDDGAADDDGAGDDDGADDDDDGAADDDDDAADDDGADDDDDDDDAADDDDDGAGEIHFKVPELPSADLQQFSESVGDGELLEWVGVVRYQEELLHSFNASPKLPDEQENETNLHEVTPEITPYRMSVSSCQRKRSMNESVWSVESLAPFIPTEEWLLQNNLFQPEITKEPEHGGQSTQTDNVIVKSSEERSQTCRLSSSDSVTMSESCLIFSTPTRKQSPPEEPEMENENVLENWRPARSQSTDPSEKVPLISPPSLQSHILSSTVEENIEENGSSEPEASQSPNQDCPIADEQQEKSCCSPEKESPLLLKSAAEKVSSKRRLILQKETDMETVGTVGQLRKEELCVPVADQKTAGLSASKGHLVDCGVQCTELQDLKCLCGKLKGNMGPNRRRPSKYPDFRKANGGKADVFVVNGHVQKQSKRNGQWRSRGQGKHSQQEDNGHGGKPGK